jgi:putative aminopeptidase FrvX
LAKLKTAEMYGINNALRCFMLNYIDYVVLQIMNLCKIPSPSGFTGKIEEYVSNELVGLGYSPVFTRKRSILVDLGGEGNGLVLTAHFDTLGAMVRSIKPNGRLRFSNIGGFPENYVENENCIIHTRSGKEYSGTVQFDKSPPHLFSSKVISETFRNDTNIEIVIDEKVKSKDDVKQLGISPGDFISFDPRTICTGSGFIKSRHLDDKVCCAILIALAKYIKENDVRLNRKVSLLFTAYEEVGHGGSAGIPDDAIEMIAVDIGIVGDDLETDEYMAAIGVKDAGGPYDFDITNKLIRLAKEHTINYGISMMQTGSTDAVVALKAGYDIKHGLVGPGVSALHGYERAHREGIGNTLELLKKYINV